MLMLCQSYKLTMILLSTVYETRKMFNFSTLQAYLSTSLFLLKKQARKPPLKTVFLIVFAGVILRHRHKIIRFLVRWRCCFVVLCHFLSHLCDFAHFVRFYHEFHQDFHQDFCHLHGWVNFHQPPAPEQYF